MTMEVWRLASSVDRYRLGLLALATVARTIGPAPNVGAIEGSGWRVILVDAAVERSSGCVVRTITGPGGDDA